MKNSKLLITAGLLLTTCQVAADSGQLLERLRINHAAMVAAEQDFHMRRERGSLSGLEAADYAAYIARLHRRVAENCVALAGDGLSAPPELGCPSQPLPVLAPVAIDQAGEQTVVEQIAVLDAELSAGLGEFDEMLLHEQERVRAATPMQDAAGGVGGGAGDAGTAEGAEGEGGDGSGESGSGSEGAESEGGDGSGESGSGSEGADGDDGGVSRDGGAGRGARQQGGRQGAPADIPDGSDDDVVARQLREAAEKETDPELKKKLWEEYRKYKQGTR